MSTSVTDIAYSPEPRWAKVPHGISFGAGANSVAVDRRDRVYVFNRGTDPVTVFDADGNFLESWGHDEFVNPHAVTVGPDGDLYLGPAKPARSSQVWLGRSGWLLCAGALECGR